MQVLSYGEPRWFGELTASMRTQWFGATRSFGATPQMRASAWSGAIAWSGALSTTTLLSAPTRMGRTNHEKLSESICSHHRARWTCGSVQRSFSLGWSLSPMGPIRSIPDPYNDCGGHARETAGDHGFNVSQPAIHSAGGDAVESA